MHAHGKLDFIDMSRIIATVVVAREDIDDNEVIAVVIDEVSGADKVINVDELGTIILALEVLLENNNDGVDDEGGIFAAMVSITYNIAARENDKDNDVAAAIVTGLSVLDGDIDAKNIGIGAAATNAALEMNDDDAEVATLGAALALNGSVDATDFGVITAASTIGARHYEDDSNAEYYIDIDSDL